MSLFQRTFNINTNLKFIRAIQQAVTSKKYGKLERGFKKAVAMSQQVQLTEQQQQEEEEEEEVGEEGEEGEGATTRKRKRPPQRDSDATSSTSSTSSTSAASAARSQLWLEWQSFSKQVVRFG